MTKSLFLILWLGVLIVFTSCVPQIDYGTRVAVIAAPTEARVPGLADRLQAKVKQQAAPAVGFIARSRVAFQETHRDMSGSRSALQAAFIAEQFGAEYALTVGAPLFVREVRTGKGARFISVAVQLEAVLYNPATAEPIASYKTPVYRTERVESLSLELKPSAEDESVLSALDRGVSFLAPGIATDLVLLAEQEN